MVQSNRSLWPLVHENPLIALLFGEDEWIDNQMIALALDPTTTAVRPSLLAYWPTLNAELGAETAFRKEGRILSDGHKGGRGIRRVYTKKALILIAMRARTHNADAFRDWLAGNAACAAQNYRKMVEASLGLAVPGSP